MNNRSFDGITIIACFVSTVLFAWFESSAFCMSDRLAFCGLAGFAVLWIVSAVYSKASTYSAPQVTPRSVQTESVPTEQVSIEQFNALQFDTVTPEEIQLEQRLTQEIDQVFAEIENPNPIAAAMTETELLHLMVDRIDQLSEAEAKFEEIESPIVHEVLPLEEVKPKSRAKTAAKTRKSAATATVKEPVEGKAKVEPTAGKAKTRSTTAKKPAKTSSKARSAKKSGELGLNLVLSL